MYSHPARSSPAKAKGKINNGKSISTNGSGNGGANGRKPGKHSPFLLACNKMLIAADGYHESSHASFFSHAHSDHLNRAGRAEKIIASDETIALAGLGAQKISLENAKLYNAGHILGARQIKVEEDGKSTVYTGDLCLRDSLVTKGAEILQCDKLIIEATYASPEYKFPDYFEVCADIARYVKANEDANIIIGCYELGKAQELVKILNEYAGIAPVVSEKMDKFCAVHEDFGIKLDRVVVGSEEAEEVMGGRFVALVAMRHAKRYFASRLAQAFGRKTFATIATGWAMNYRFNVDYAFPLSDHVDFYDLKNYVEQSGAKEFEFFQGDGTKVLQAAGKQSQGRQ